jgi:hypothetical protein
MASNRAPKQWPLTKQETITSFEAWRQNLQYTLSLDPNFAPFLIDGLTWLKKTTAAPLRGFENDADTVPVERRRTAEQKAARLELILGQIANYCPVLNFPKYYCQKLDIFEHYLASDSGSLWVSVHRWSFLRL